VVFSLIPVPGFPESSFTENGLRFFIMFECCLLVCYPECFVNQQVGSLVPLVL